MSWYSYCVVQEGKPLSIKQLISIHKRQSNHCWLEPRRCYCRLETRESFIWIDTTHTTTWSDWLILKPSTFKVSLKVSSNTVLLVLPHLSWIATKGHVFYRFNNVEEGLLSYKQDALRKQVLSRRLEKLVLQDIASMRELLGCLLQLTGEFLDEEWQQWKTDDYSSGRTEDMISSNWIEKAHRWIRSYYIISQAITKLSSLVTCLIQQDSTFLALVLVSGPLFLEHLSSRKNEIIRWKTQVGHLEQAISSSFRHSELQLLTIDLPIMTGSALFGFCLLVIGLSAMNFTIPPYNYPFALKIWVVLISILAFLILTGFSLVFLWLRNTAVSSNC